MIPLLLDNGSLRPQSTLGLRRIAKALSQRIGEQVHPVSLNHSHRIPPEALGGQPAQILESFLRDWVARGHRRFLILPLFFSEHRSLAQHLARFPALDIRLAPPLYPLPQGEPKLVQILWEQAQGHEPKQRLILVDHGSPDPAVTAVRNHLAEQLGRRLDLPVSEAVMERRPGAAYDFNGPSLAQRLQRWGQQETQINALILPLFLLPGRHAGPGGDLEKTCTRFRRSLPAARIQIAPLVGEHPLLIEILQARWQQAISGSSAGSSGSGSGTAP